MSNQLGDIFLTHLSDVQKSLELAEKSENPALFLFKNKTRNSFFYLEAICRLMAKIEHHKYWEKYKFAFKEIEDLFGMIDYWNELYQIAAQNKKIPAEIKTYFSDQLMKSSLNLNEVLNREEWIWHGSKKINKISRKIISIEWMEEDEFISKTTKYYYKCIEKIEPLLIKQFKDIEADIHELRKEIRWLSIFPQALPGYFTLHNTKADAKIKKYLTTEIVNSPYNILKTNRKIKEKLVFNKPNYLAMSWLINATGISKDEGQKIEAFSKAYKKTFKLDDNEVTEVLNTLFKNNQSIEEILRSCNQITIDFHDENILENLIAI